MKKKFHIKKDTLKKHAIILLLAVFLIGILGTIHGMLQWKSTNFFGEIVQVTPTSFIISDKEVGKREFILTPKTKVFKGKNTTTYPKVGDEVIIVGEKLPNGTIQAKGVRIVNNKINIRDEK